MRCKEEGQPQPCEATPIILGMWGEQRADRPADKLRALGIDPDRVG
jgi:hypothetical protein